MLLREGRHLRDRMVGLERNRRCVCLESGKSLPYDVLSIDVGSVVPPLAGDNAGLMAVKPIANLAVLRKAVEERLATTATCDVAIAGSGVTAFEVAANLVALGARLGGKIAVSIYGRKPLAGLPPGARDILIKNLSQRGVAIHCGMDVKGADGHCLLLKDGTRRSYDIAVNATGLIPPPLVSTLGLPLDDHGALVTDEFLRCEDGVFAAGDCIAFDGKALPPVGVHAVRQSAVLLDNIQASLGGGSLRAFRPRRRYGSIINLGDGTAIALWGGLWMHGRMALMLKDFIDLRFVDR